MGLRHPRVGGQYLVLVHGVLYFTQGFQAAGVEQMTGFGAKGRIRGDQAIEGLLEKG